MAAVQAAYGKRPAVPVDWPEAPAVEPMPDPQDLGDDVIKDGWSEQMLFQVIAPLMPRAREVIRRVVDVGGTATYDSVQQYFAPAIRRWEAHQRSGGGPPAGTRHQGQAAAAGRAGTRLPHRPRAAGALQKGLRPCRCSHRPLARRPVRDGHLMRPRHR